MFEGTVPSAYLSRKDVVQPVEVQPVEDSYAWDKYITDTHSPCGTVWSGLSRMEQVHHRHT